MNNDYINIGKIVTAHGLTGEVLLKHALGKKTIFKENDTVFIEQVKGSYLPHFVQSSKIKAEDETIIKFDDVDSREKALKFLQKQVWLTQEDFRKFAAKSSPISLLGFTLINEGETVGVIEMLAEMLAVIMFLIGYEHLVHA